jgi:hypothetical protein
VLLYVQNCCNCIVFSFRVNTLRFTERNIKKVNNWNIFVNKTNFPTVTVHVVCVCYFLYSAIYRNAAEMENLSIFNYIWFHRSFNIAMGGFSKICYIKRCIYTNPYSFFTVKCNSSMNTIYGLFFIRCKIDLCVFICLCYTKCSYTKCSYTKCSLHKM